MPARLLLLMCCFSFSVFGQWDRGTLSAGVGGGFPAGGENVYRTSYLPDSAAFSVGYEFRLFKYLAPEVNVVNLTPLVPQFGQYPLPPTRERVTLISLGARGILPLHPGRVELFAGGGAVNVSRSDIYVELYALGMAGQWRRAHRAGQTAPFLGWTHGALVQEWRPSDRGVGVANGRLRLSLLAKTRMLTDGGSASTLSRHA